MLDYQNRRFLVTGGAGFIGSHLCETILRNGGRVRCLDDFSVGKRENIAAFMDSPAFELIEGDIKNAAACLEACDGVDFVLHEAAFVSVPLSIENPLACFDSNVRGTFNMLEAARRCGVKKFVYATSAAVYGDDSHFPQQEGREGAPLSPYALSKKSGEDWAAHYAKIYGLETIGLRYFNAFGQRQDPKGAYASVIPKFITQMLRREIPTVHGDGEQTRDFVHVSSLVAANLKACLAPKEASGQVFNIASGKSRRLIEVYYLIAKALGVEQEPHFGPERAGDIKHSSADISKAQRVLGYQPSDDFAGELAVTVEWYKDSFPH